MRIAFMLLVGIFASVHTFDSDFANLAFKKYATIKVLEDCVGKEVVAKMCTEVKQAASVCRRKPSAQFKLADLPSAGLSIFKENKAGQQVKAAHAQSNLPIYFLHPVPPQSFDGFPYYPGPSYLRSGHSNHPYQRLMYGYQPYRKAREASDETKEVPTDRAIQADAEPVSQNNAALSFESSLMQNPKSSKLMEKLLSKIGNVTCVLQELNFLGADMQPNYDGIRNRIRNCPIDPALKADFIEGVDTCKDFSQCVPAKKVSSIPLFQEIARPLTFFQCFKGKKLETCMKKDLREKLETLLGAAEWASSRQAGEVEEDTPQLDESDMFNMMFGFDMLSEQSNIF